MSYQVRTKNGYDFFEVSSAFQKSIRRCDEDQAMFWAVELYESNYAKYVWKRMIVMASEDVGLAEPNLPAQIMALKESFDYFITNKDKHKADKLPFTHAVLLLVRAKKSRFIDLSISVHWGRHDELRQTMTIPDYAYDMHTRKGKSMGRGLEHFYAEGSLINNEGKVEREETFENMAKMMDMKMLGEKPKGEDPSYPIPDKPQELFP